MRDENAVPVVMANDLGHLITSSFSAENVWASLVVFAACTWTITTIFITILGKNSIQKIDLKSSTEQCLKAIRQCQWTFSWTVVLLLSPAIFLRWTLAPAALLVYLSIPPGMAAGTFLHSSRGHADFTCLYRISQYWRNERTIKILSQNVCLSFSLQHHRRTGTI